MDYNRQQFIRMVEHLRGFRKLIAILDADAALSVAMLLFEAQARETDPAGRYVQLPAGGEEEYASEINKHLWRECDQIRQKRTYMVDLLQAAQAGKLRARLEQMTEPEVNYATLYRGPQHAPQAREIAKAAGWVGRSMHGEGPRLAGELLTRHVLTEPAGAALGRTPELLDRIHAQIVPDAPKARSPNPATAYPSSIGGRYLLELIFELTAGTEWPGRGDEHWIDVALFYLGAVTTVQGYPDGNKRIGRLAYAITLLKGSRPFVAPSLPLEADLIDALVWAQEDQMTDDRCHLTTAYKLTNPEESREFYQGWAEGYDDEIAENGYITPQRCAEALAAHASAPWAPLMDLGCGTGISGLALKAAGFECIDGYDFSQAMLDRAAAKGVYRQTAIADLSKPLEIAEGIYQNAAAVGCITPEYMPATVLDEILSKLPQGGCLVFSVNDHSAADGSILGRIMTLIDCGAAELAFKEYGDHLPGIGLKATVYVLRKR
jgi:hypothetical protein